jgi:hypothetical protein
MPIAQNGIGEQQGLGAHSRVSFVRSILLGVCPPGRRSVPDAHPSGDPLAGATEKRARETPPSHRPASPLSFPTPSQLLQALDTVRVALARSHGATGTLIERTASYTNLRSHSQGKVLMDRHSECAPSSARPHAQKAQLAHQKRPWSADISRVIDGSSIPTPWGAHGAGARADGPCACCPATGRSWGSAMAAARTPPRAACRLPNFVPADAGGRLRARARRRRRIAIALLLLLALVPALARAQSDEVLGDGRLTITGHHSAPVNTLFPAEQPGVRFVP